MDAKRKFTFKITENGLVSYKVRDLDLRAGDAVQLVFKVYDLQGEAADLSDNAASFKIARAGYDSAVISKTESDGVTVAGNVITVDFLANEELLEGGIFWFNLYLANDSEATEQFMLAYGRLNVGKYIQ